jgi:hypothetical protein
MTRIPALLLISIALVASACSSSHDTGGSSGGSTPGATSASGSKTTGAAGQGSSKGTSAATIGMAGTGSGTGAGTGGAMSSGGGAMSAGSGGKSGMTGSGTGGTTAGAAGGGSATAGSSAPSGSATAPACDQVKSLVEAYKAAHPGNGGKDWDINAKTPAEISADPAAQQLRALCGPNELPVIPLLAWEYGGGDHQWINPDMSALVYCVSIPVNPSSAEWQYDAAKDHVTADVSIKCPELNPCKDKQGADQVTACIGDSSNFEILVDTASINDGADVGLTLANSSTDLNLVLQDGSKVHLYTGT